MPRFDSLGKYLAHSGMQEITLSFQRIQEILGFDLPASAKQYPAWWSNTGHSHAASWTAFGYRARTPDFSRGTVCFQKFNRLAPSASTSTKSKQVQSPTPSISTACSASGTMDVCGYPFVFVQELIPEQTNGKPMLYNPQAQYQNKDHLPLLKHGHGPFCRFHAALPQAAGLYLWVVDNQIVYIGEACDLRRRFSTGYGNISPRNCYKGGQSTNCKMNKVVLQSYMAGTPVRLYIYLTASYKEIELELLGKINTKYNVKDN